MLKGKPFKGARALEVGLLDRTRAAGGAQDSAPSGCCCSPPAEGRAVRREAAESRWRCGRSSRARPLPRLRGKVPREHYPAPYAMLDLWRRYGAAGAESYEAEARSIGDAHVHADLAQPGAGVPAAGSTQRARRQAADRVPARARHRRRRHGRRHRGVGGAARHDASRCRTAPRS